MEHATITRTETVPIDSVTPHPQNARRGNVERIERSLREHGQYAPIVVHEETGFILKGNNTWRVLREKIGATGVLATYVKCTEAQARAILVADNRSSDDASYDEAALAALLEQISDDGWLRSTGYEQADVDDLLALMEESGEDAYDPLEHVPNALGVSDTADAGIGTAPPPPTANRMIILNYAGPTFLWMQDRLAELCEEWEVESNADMVLALVEEATGQKAPQDNESSTGEPSTVVYPDGDLEPSTEDGE